MKQKARCTWHLNRNCNFKCDYCYVKHFKKNEPGHGWEKDVEAFKNADVDWQCISMSGGEPFIYPDFVKLCEELTKFTKIIVTTNCSTSNVYEFADKIDPKQVIEIHVSLHIGQRHPDKYDELIEKIKYLRDKGFHVFVSQVLHPKLFDEYINVFKYFAKRSIYITPKVLEGVWHGREYPQAYTEKQRRIMLEFADIAIDQPSKNNIHKYGTMLYGCLDWYCRFCNAGYNNMQIQYNGDAYRCHGDRQYLGNLYEGTIRLSVVPYICLAKECTCESEGWQGHSVDGHIIRKQNLKKIAKHYAVQVLSRLGWTP